MAPASDAGVSTAMTDLDHLADQENIPRLSWVSVRSRITGLGAVEFVDAFGRPHRTHAFGLPIDAPARMDLDGTRHWFQNGVYFRAKNRATVVSANGDREWLEGPEPGLHRGPKMPDGSSGPAIVCKDGRVSYYDEEGRFVRGEVWTRKQAKQYFAEPFLALFN